MMRDDDFRELDSAARDIRRIIVAMIVVLCAAILAALIYGVAA